MTSPGQYEDKSPERCSPDRHPSDSRSLDRRLSVAPMLDWTDRHCRYFLRAISPGSLLFSEMVTTGAILYGDRERHLGFSREEHPIVLQLGGADPAALAECARIGEDYGYDEINLNVGCPSNRVQSGAFGACLMATPQVVAQCVAAMRAVVHIPVSVKCRIGIDEQDQESDFSRFVEIVADAGTRVFYVHARKAWLKGLNPKQNRDIPPLDYERVFRLKQIHPGLEIILNGGLKTVADCQQVMPFVDGVMIGREAYKNPWILRDMETALLQRELVQVSRESIAQQMQVYIERIVAQGGREHMLTRHMSGLFQAQPGARRWRQSLSEPAISTTRQAGSGRLAAALQSRQTYQGGAFQSLARHCQKSQDKKNQGPKMQSK